MAPLQQLRRKASHCGEPRRGAGAARNPARSDTIPFLSADTQPRGHPPSPIRGRGRVGDIKAPFFLGKRLAAQGSLPPSPAARPHGGSSLLQGSSAKTTAGLGVCSGVAQIPAPVAAPPGTKSVRAVPSAVPTPGCPRTAEEEQRQRGTGGSRRGAARMEPKSGCGCLRHVAPVPAPSSCAAAPSAVPSSPCPRARGEAMPDGCPASVTPILLGKRSRPF